jgi:hypothetical protein
MKADKIFPQLLRLVEYGDRISKGCKTGAHISFGEGGVLLTNDMNSVIVLVEHSEFIEELGFKSHLFPDPIAPLGISGNDGSIDFTWMEKGIKKKVNIPSCSSKYEKGKKVVDKLFKMDNSFLLPTSSFEVIDDDIHVLKLKREEKRVLFEQMKTTGEEIFTNEIPLKSGGLMSHLGDVEIKEVETIVSTIEFKMLPVLTDDTVMKLSISEDGEAIFGEISMGSVTAKVIVAPMKYER